MVSQITKNEKNKIYLAVVSILVIVGLFLFKYKNNNKVIVDQIQTNTPEEPVPTKTKPIVFTQEQLDEYYQTTKNPYVLHIRKVLDGYLNGKNIGMASPELVIETHKVEEYTAGLSSIDKEYYKSKFIVFSMNDSIAGGVEVSIIFQDKPDKLFTVWVYQLAGGEYDFRSIRDNPKFTLEKMKEIQILYKTILEDEVHSI
ncbi:hypothetical protein KKE47_01180 [Patescibacteria group bacterium]|nr:hypothetical protein [Patescibacteria group bacterium]MBU4264676.1 hypothetical protein [Patescibacteria group bacterium]MBU4390631.1 hypothetical protein [Patescibacteria group bacterium]MBU4431027.1 hypothetical protein [Patescibacteria group bacterium]